ncbi:MAG: nucleotide exchange factor GrpE [Clostridia bacterium]|nr:nucleotide exchange factor GrpE [Clostridia bacterium]
MKKRRDKGKMEKKQDEILEEKVDTEEETAANKPEAESAAEASAEEVKAEEEDPAQKALDEANAKATEYLQLAQRVQADFENFRRRNETVRADAYADGRKDVATVMLPVLDNLERAVEAAAGSQDEALKNGVEMVLKQMTDAYGKLDVKPIDRLGEKFDPNLENAILQGNEEDGEPGTVCQVLQKGYMIGDKVLRHAMVKVVPE